MRVELLFFEDCPNVARVRELVVECLAELRLDVAVDERTGDYRSPTVLIDGDDVMGAPLYHVRACRIDLPTKHKLIAALQCAKTRRP
jgi:hypothetical protein